MSSLIFTIVEREAVMQELTLKQKNSLIIGTVFSAELLACNAENRRFVSVYPYELNEQGRRSKPDKYISSEKYETTLFYLRDYEYPSKYIENDQEVYDGDIIYHHKIVDIRGISELERILSGIMTDFSQLVPMWQTDDIL